MSEKIYCLVDEVAWSDLMNSILNRSGVKREYPIQGESDILS